MFMFFHGYKNNKYFEISRKKYSRNKINLITSNNFKKILQITKYKIIHVYEILNIQNRLWRLDMKYIGQVKRKIKYRFSGHFLHIKLKTHTKLPL